MLIGTDPVPFPPPLAAAWDGGFGLGTASADPPPRRCTGPVALALLILLAASAMVGWLTWDLRRGSLDQANEQQIRLADRAAALLAKDIDINALLIETIRISLDNPSVARLDDTALHAALFDRINAIGGIGEILVTDGAGQVVQSLNPRGKLHVGIGGRDFFKAHRDDTQIGLQISGPCVSPFTGEPMVILSRRRRDGGDAFTGVVLASIRVSYLQSLLARADEGNRRLFTVMRTDGTVLAQAGAAGSAAVDAALLDVTARMRSGTYSGRSSLDQVERLHAYRTLDNAPLVVVVSSQTSDVLRHWNRLVRMIGTGVALLDVASIVLVLAIRRELRRRHLAETQAKRSETRLRLRIETIEDHAFIAVDLNGRIASWNVGAQDMLGYHAAQVVGQPIERLLAEPEAIHADPAALDVSRAVGRWETETDGRRFNGTTFPATIVVSVILDLHDEPQGHAVIIHDLTKKRRLERRLRAMERMDAIGQVTSGVAHDFNNLLQAQIMSLELLQDRLEPDSPDRELSDVALNAAEQAARLTDQLLAFSRQQVLRPSRVDVRDLLASVIALAQHTVGPNIRLISIVGRELSAISVDSAQLQTALLNLVINARDAITGSGTITLHSYLAETGVEPPAGSVSDTGFVILAVTDTGCGMDQPTTERAIEPFFTTKGANGSGLGLSMVQGFARQSGGDIRIISAPMRGTSVQIWLPCVTDSAEIVCEPPPPPLPARTTHVLLVDDVPDILLVMAAFLRGAGFAVTVAGNAREALWRLQRGTPFALMVTDFLMPGMDGLDLARAARRLHPDLAVLIISGFAQSDRLAQLPPGCALLRKPFRKQDFLASVARLLPRDPGDAEPARPMNVGDGCPGPHAAGAVVEPSSWPAQRQSAEPPPKPTSA